MMKKEPLIQSVLAFMLALCLLLNTGADAVQAADMSETEGTEESAVTVQSETASAEETEEADPADDSAEEASAETDSAETDGSDSDAASPDQVSSETDALSEESAETADTTADETTNETSAEISDTTLGGDADTAYEDQIGTLDSYTAYTYSYTYVSLNDVTLSESSVTVSDVQEELETFLNMKEGNYDSVNKDDNGSLSLGILQWHGANALLLMRLIISEDNASAYSALGESLYNEVIDSSTTWSNRTLSSEEAVKFKAALGTTASQTVQDKLADSYTASYINAATGLGIVNPAAIFIYGDVRNQRGSSGAKMTAENAAALAGSYSAVTGNDMLIASVYSYPTTSSYYTSFVKRRLSCYQYAVDLGWTYKLENDYLIPSGRTAAESTAVSWVQYVLNLVNDAGLTITGIYDSATIAAVTAFQTDQDLDADGEVSQQTIAALITVFYEYVTTNNTTTAELFADSAESILKIIDYNCPKTICAGRSCLLRGIIRSNYRITRVIIQVTDASGETVSSAVARPNAKCCSIRAMFYREDIFSGLSKGTYTYEVIASDTKTSNVTLLSKTFKVK